MAGKNVWRELKPPTFNSSLDKDAIRNWGEGRGIPRRFDSILTRFKTLYIAL